MHILNKRILECRTKLKGQDKKWTQDYVAKRISVARVTYTAYEKGTKMPQIETLIKLVSIFGVSADYLLGITDDL